MIIEKISGTLATKMKSIVGNEIKYESDELEFGLKIAFNTVAIIGLSLIIGVFLQIFSQVVITMIAFVGLRAITGGYHLKSSDYCVVASTSLMLLIAECSKYTNDELIFYTTILSTILILIFAPKNMVIYYFKSNRTINNLLLKITSLILVLMSYFLHNTIVSLAFLVQCLTLIPKQEEE